MEADAQALRIGNALTLKIVVNDRSIGGEAVSLNTINSGGILIVLEVNLSCMPGWTTEATVSSVSANGRFFAGSIDGIISVGDTHAGTVDYYYDENGIDEYSVGVGTCAVSNDGITCISTSAAGAPSYIEDGVIKTLPLPEGISVGMANAITPDGSRIAGTIGVAMSAEAKDVMQKPVVWDRQADGTYGAPVALPYPAKDITGRTPQYILVDGISADGKIIACEQHDNFGAMDIPMVISQDSEGNWSYKFLGKDLVSESELTLSEAPDPADFMTPEELAAYNEAVANSKNAVMPDALDYMTDEQKAQYEADLAEQGYIWDMSPYMDEEAAARYEADVDAYYAAAYPVLANFMSEEEAEDYNAAFDAWSEEQEIYWELMGTAVMFEMNGFTLSPSGKYYAVTAVYTKQTVDPDDEENVVEEDMAAIFTFDTADGSYTERRTETEFFPTFVANDGTLLAVKQGSFWDMDRTTNSFVSAGLDGDFVALHNHIQNQDPSLHAWIMENMSHAGSEWDWDLEEDVPIEVFETGAAYCDHEMKTFFSFSQNTWDNSADSFYYVYYLPLGDTSAIGNIAVDAAEAAADTEAVYYNLQGHRISNPQSGMYIKVTGKEATKMVK